VRTKDKNFHSGPCQQNNQQLPILRVEIKEVANAAHERKLLPKRKQERRSQANNEDT
jgi:hypothetical protein